LDGFGFKMKNKRIFVEFSNKILEDFLSGNFEMKKKKNARKFKIIKVSQNCTHEARGAFQVLVESKKMDNFRMIPDDAIPIVRLMLEQE